METIRSGPYVFRLGLYADSDLSPANLGEAFDYYSGVPGWGWRALVYAEPGKWGSPAVQFGALVNEIEYALPDPEGELDSYFPCGRAVALVDGGIAYEGGVAVPPRVLPGLGDTVGVWVTARDDSGSFGAELRFLLVENERWDGLEPSACVSGPRTVGRARETWSPVEEPSHTLNLPASVYREPLRPDVPDQNSSAVEKALELARDEALRLKGNRPGSEELLLGLLRAGVGEAFATLSQAGVSLRDARAAVQFLRTATLGAQPALGTGLLPTAAKALELARDEARRQRSHRITTAHLLAGLLRQEGGAAAMLDWLGVSADAIRSHLEGVGAGEED